MIALVDWCHATTEMFVPRKDDEEERQDLRRQDQVPVRGLRREYKREPVYFVKLGCTA